MKQVAEINFPKFKGLDINMMPIVMGNIDSLPAECRDYFPLIQECKFTPGDVVYLTITEAPLKKGEYNRRPGVHTDATNKLGWGGGGWGGTDGIYLSSNDGACKIWPFLVSQEDVNSHGGLLNPPDPSLGIDAKSNILYQISDLTPHETLPAKKAHNRQFFRLVGPKIGGWFEKHSTPNPIGVQPQAPILRYSKFD